MCDGYFEYLLLAVGKSTFALSFTVLCVAVAVSWDPTLSHYVRRKIDGLSCLIVRLLLQAVAVTWTVIIQMGVKLLGSIVFQLKRLGRAALRQCCLRFCYRVEQDPMNHPRLVCCLRPSSFWALDDLQEAGKCLNVF